MGLRCLVLMLGVGVVLAALAGAPCAAQGAAPPTVFVLTGNALVRLDWDESAYALRAKGAFDKAIKPKFARNTYVCAAGEYVFVMDGARVVKFDRDCRASGEKTFDDLSAIGTDGSTLFACADGSLVALDQDLNERSRAYLSLGGAYVGGKARPKNAHDVVVYQGTAHLLDNIMAPLYVVKVDVSDPSKLHVVKTYEFQEVNAHLPTQWVDPASDKWLVLFTTGHKGGSGEAVLTFNLDGSEINELSDETIWWFNRMKKESKGFRVLGVTQTPPLWAVIQPDKATDAQLARVEGARFTPVVALEGEWKEEMRAKKEAIVRSADGFVVVARRGSDRMEVFDAGGATPKRCAGTSFKDLGGLLDVLVAPDR